MPPEFDVVEEADRRFVLRTVPKFEPNVPLEQLMAVGDEIIREKWKLDNVNSQKLDYAIQSLVELNNGLYHLETEVIRSKQFRRYVWNRVVIVVLVLCTVWQLLVNFGPLILKAIVQ